MIWVSWERERKVDFYRISLLISAPFVKNSCDKFVEVNVVKGRLDVFEIRLKFQPLPPLERVINRSFGRLETAESLFASQSDTPFIHFISPSLSLQNQNMGRWMIIIHEMKPYMNPLYFHGLVLTWASPQNVWWWCSDEEDDDYHYFR